MANTSAMGLTKAPAKTKAKGEQFLDTVMIMNPRSQPVKLGISGFFPGDIFFGTLTKTKLPSFRN